jgi:ADP-ribose pyrophosphatase YjhB (NUDIX family)
MKGDDKKFRCVLHGSFGKHFSAIENTHRIFTKADIGVLAPKMAEFTSARDGFLLFEDERGQDPRMVELVYLQHLKKLGSEGFSYFVNPGGYMGKSASYELGIAQATNIPCFFMEKPKDHPVYIHANSIWKPEHLAEYITEHGELPGQKTRRSERRMGELFQELLVPGSVVATGGIIEYDSGLRKREKEILLVKTHKWGGRYSIVGGKVKRNERLSDALLREVREETKLKGSVGAHLCTFDQIRNSGYYQRGISYVFVDNIVPVTGKRVSLNDEAEEYVWMPARTALRDLDIEPNARHTVELYAAQSK